MKYIIPVILLFTAFPSSAQPPEYDHLITDSIIKRIDSAKAGAGIEEGRIFDTESGEKTGNFANWYYTDSSKKYLLKVVEEISADTRDFTSYYFYEDKLILVILKKGRTEGDSFKTVSTDKHYFQNNKLQYSFNESDIHFNAASYLQNADRYLKNSDFWGRRDSRTNY